MKDRAEGRGRNLRAGVRWLRFLKSRALLALRVFALPFLASAGPAYPLKMSIDRRFLVDQSNAPVMIVGDSPQALMVNLTTNEAATFFADRATYGFNTVWVN